MQKIIIVAGPTGVGKTALGIELAKLFNGEIISGDSIQVYKGLNIGSAKVTKEEMAEVKHHLIDILDIEDEYSVKQFQQQGRFLIQRMIDEYKMPIIVGGTGLYLKSLYYDYEFSDEQVDEEYQAFLKSRSDGECYAMLRLVDRDACDKIHKNNRKRVERALMRAYLGNKKSEAEANQNHQPIYDAFVIGLTSPKEVLYQRINERVIKMMEMGLLDEMKGLMEQFQNRLWDYQGLQGIGYKEWKNYFLGNQDLDETVALIQKHSRQFAKRQYTWFNHQMEMHWFDVTKDGWKKDLLEQLKIWIGDCHE